MKQEQSLSEKVMDYIEEHLSDPLNLEHIACQVGYSKYHLTRTFTKEVGCSMHQYLQRRRLEEAAKRLEKTKEPICEIALEAGYDSQQAFTYAFKRIYLASPYSYRKEKQLAIHSLKLGMFYSGFSSRKKSKHKKVLYLIKNDDMASYKRQQISLVESGEWAA
ncbi:MAG: helix-turn-helix transcriptional regulator [Cellulosilyticum sp.]|nr:helix-turn-helix transcriptional regulator [Cellulosilyticum sp.]